MPQGSVQQGISTPVQVQAAPPAPPQQQPAAGQMGQPASQGTVTLDTSSPEYQLLQNALFQAMQQQNTANSTVTMQDLANFLMSKVEQQLTLKEGDNLEISREKIHGSRRLNNCIKVQFMCFAHVK